MAIPVISGATEFFDFDSLTGTAWGVDSAKWIVETDVKVEGSASIGLPPKTNNSEGGYGYHALSAINATTNLIGIWVFTVQGYCNTKDNYGVFIRLTSDVSGWTNYIDYKVGGSDIPWVGQGWHLVVLDANRTADRSNGSVSKTAIRGIGVGFNWIATSLKSTCLGVDIVYYGQNIEVTGVTSSGTTVHSFTYPDTISKLSGSFVTDGFQPGDLIKISGTQYNDGYHILKTVASSSMTVTLGTIVTEGGVTSNVDGFVTLDDIYQKDGPTDGKWIGAVTKNPTGSFSINWPLVIGDQSGTSRSSLVSRGDVVFLADQPIYSKNMLSCAQDTGASTRILFGDSSGSGDDRVGFNGSYIKAEPSSFAIAPQQGIDFSAAIAALELYGSVFHSIDLGVSLGASTIKRAASTTFSECGQVDLSSVESRRLVFSGYSSGSNAALLWNDNINIKNSQFLANANTSGSSHAIEHPTSGSFDYDALVFSGNDFDINFSASSGSLVINALNGANPSTYQITNGGADVDIINAVMLKMTIKDRSNNPIENAQCAIFRISDGTQLMNEDSLSTGVAEEAFNYPGSTVDIYWRVRKSSTGGTRYKSQGGTGTVTGDGFSVTVTLEVEPLT